MGGLFLLSIVNSAGVPTGGGPDIVIALLASLHPNAPYAMELVIAAIISCSMLYSAGLRGGEAGARRFAPDAVFRPRISLERYGARVVFLAMLAPPLIPTKLFVSCAGVAAVPTLRFLIATIAGRAIPYSAGAVLALRYGPSTCCATARRPSCCSCAALPAVSRLSRHPPLAAKVGDPPLTRAAGWRRLA
jgi:membrane protein YqaA with SNARE-associated domain